MSMLMQYFVADEPSIQAWVESLTAHDGMAQSKAEARMASAAILKNISDTDVRLLACCAEEYAGDITDGTDLVAAVDEEIGPWVMAFADEVVDAIAAIVIDDQLIRQWVDRAAEHTGDYKHRAKYLTADSAQRLQAMCRAAMDRHLHFYCCYFG